MVAFRNVFIDAYFQIDLEIVWATALNRLKSVSEQIRIILAQDFPAL